MSIPNREALERYLDLDQVRDALTDPDQTLIVGIAQSDGDAAGPPDGPDGPPA